MHTSESTRIVPLRLRDARSVELVGGKAATLGRLLRAGLPVPEGFVVPAGGPIGAQIGATIDAARAAFLELTSAHAPIAAGGVAVRSSATLEDRDDASFAGQFATLLDVRDAAALERAVRTCLASARSAAVAAYCSARALDQASIRMAVVVQRMVRAEVAGVLFTVHPTRGDEREILIEACVGSTDAVTFGRATGESIVATGGCATASSQLLDAAQIAELAELGRRIQRLEGAPQDIEWALERGRFQILQSRPITRLSFAAVDGQWTNADFRDGGVASGVCAPLTWSLYARSWERALLGYLRELRLLDGDGERGFECARLFFGRPYWNLGAVKRCARKLPGFVEREFDQDLAVEPLYQGDGVRTPTNVATLLAAVPTLLATARTFRRQERLDVALLRRDPAATRAPALDPLADGELAARFVELVRGDHLTVESEYFRTIFTASIAKLALKLSLDRLDRHDVSYAKLVAGIENVSHVRTATALWHLAGRGDRPIEGDAELARFLDEHGHHGKKELDLREPRWREEPELVVELAALQAGTVSPSLRAAEQHRLFESERARTRRLLPWWRRRLFDRRLARLRRYLWLREEMRDRSIRLHAEVRRLALEIGRRAAAAGRLATADDVFLLNADEVADVATRSFVATVAPRRTELEMHREFRAPNEIGRGFRLAPAVVAKGRLAGIGASDGVATGVVRVVHSPARLGRFDRGDVLVCPHTDPGWTPLLALAGAVVTETGGLLSHAALLCREFGIPAVLSVAAATRTLRDGARVRVDGGEGHVDRVA